MSGPAVVAGIVKLFVHVQANVEEHQQQLYSALFSSLFSELEAAGRNAARAAAAAARANERESRESFAVLGGGAPLGKAVQQLYRLAVSFCAATAARAASRPSSCVSS